MSGVKPRGRAIGRQLSAEPCCGSHEPADSTVRRERRDLTRGWVYRVQVGWRSGRSFTSTTPPPTAPGLNSWSAGLD